MAATLAAEFDVARAARAARASRRAASPPTAGRCARATRSPRIPATRADGRAFIPDAIARGAGAVLWEARGFHWDAAWRVPQRRRRRSARRSSAPSPIVIYGHPSRDAVDGRRHRHQRQDVVHALDRAVRSTPAAGARRSLGTLGNGLVGALEPSAHTTPDAARAPRDARALARRAARRRSRWRSRRTASTRAASTASSSTSRCSRT